MNKMLKWPGSRQWCCILCFSYCFTNQFRSPSMTTMNKLLKHPLRLHFFNSVDNISKTLLQESVSTEKTVSVNATRDLFTFFKMLTKISVGDCGCCIALKLQLNRRKISVEVFGRHITLASDKHKTTLPQTYSDYKSMQRQCCDDKDKTS